MIVRILSILNELAVWAAVMCGAIAVVAMLFLAASWVLNTFGASHGRLFQESFYE